MEIYNISDLDLIGKEYDKEIDKALLTGAYKVAQRAREHLTSVYPSTNTFRNGIFVGRLKDKAIKVTALGTKGDLDYKARFFVGGTKERFAEGGYRKTKDGIQYVPYKKRVSKGSIKATDSVSTALREMGELVHELIKNINI